MLPALRKHKNHNGRSVAIVKCLIFISVFLSSLALAQDQTLLEPDLEEAGARVARWDNRVKEFISISENSAAKLPEAEQALYLALLAKLTWTRDERAARGCMARAANVVLSELSEKRPGERRRQADFAVKALSLLFELDGPYATELVARLNRDLDNESCREISDLGRDGQGSLNEFIRKHCTNHITR